MQEKAKEQEMKDAADMVTEIETNEESPIQAVGELMTTSEEFWSGSYGSKERLAPLQPKSQQDTYIREEASVRKPSWMSELPPILEIKPAVSEIIEVTPQIQTAGPSKPWLSRKKPAAKGPETSNMDSLHRSQSNLVAPSQSFARNEGAYN